MLGEDGLSKEQAARMAGVYGRGYTATKREVAALLAEARAEELELAADQVGPELGNEVHGHTSTRSVRLWLRARAALVRHPTEGT